MLDEKAIFATINQVATLSLRTYGMTVKIYFPIEHCWKRLISVKISRYEKQEKPGEQKGDGGKYSLLARAARQFQFYRTYTKNTIAQE